MAGGLNVYVTEHYAQPGVAESAYYATTTSPRVLPQADLATEVNGRIPDPAQRFWHHTLDYPEVPADPAEAVARVMERYRRCSRCHLSNRRNLVSFVKGDPNSPVVLFGEGPGKSEDTAGVPFCGPSGRLEDELLRECGIDPMALAWINLVGCRPCNNRFADDRPPSLVEKVACSERTFMLLRALRPSVVVCLGGQATNAFWDDVPYPWTWHTVGTVTVGHARHPAYMLRSVMAPGGEREYEAARHFYGALKERLPGLCKLPAWPLPLNYLSEASRVLVGT